MKLWNNLNARERLLAKITSGLLIAILVLGVLYKGINDFKTLDNRMESLEMELINLHQYKAQRDSVETAFDKVVEEHSSELTKEEIHDGLRREIYRLALRNPELPYKSGKSKSSNDYIVQIPSLREGVLKEEGEGYREYQVRFTIPSCTPLMMLTMTMRLETSDMLLRIDSFEMTRDPSGTLVRVTYEVTRTVLDNPEEVESDALAATNRENSFGSRL